MRLLDGLHDGVVLSIAGQLQPVDLKSACQVCRAWNSAIYGLLTTLQPSDFSSQLASRLPDLRSLDLSRAGPVLDDERLASVSSLRSLKHLELTGCTHITRAGLAGVAQLPGKLWRWSVACRCHSAGQADNTKRCRAANPQSDALPLSRQFG